MEKVGRNDPCPCGSGKKYKKCCLNKKKEISPDLLWLQCRTAEDSLIEKLMHFMKHRFGADCFDIAWEEFTGYREKYFPDENPHIQIFIPWVLYNWLPAFSLDDKLIPKAYNTVTDFYLEKFSDRLTPMERNFAQQANKEPYCFYEVTNVQLNYGMTLKNILSDETVIVREKTGTQNVEAGSIIFARIINIDDLNLICGCSSIIIPLKYKINILNFKDFLLETEKKVTEQKIIELQAQFIDLYLEIFQQITTPPKIVNKSGDELVFIDIKYEIEDPESVWKKLRHLDNIWTDDEFQEMGEFDENGKLYKINFSWLSPQKRNEINPSIYAHFTICGSELTVSVNSKKREKYAKVKIKKILADKAKYKMSIVRSVEQVMKDDKIRPEPDMTEKKLEESPEVHQMMDQFFENHWKNWIDSKIPALGNISPREASKTSIGREKLLALFEDFENREKRQSNQINQLKYIRNARKELNLDS